MNGIVTPQHGGDDDGAVEEEEHAARQKPRTNAVKSRIVIVPFCDRNKGLESILGLSLTPKVGILHLRRLVTTRGGGFAYGAFGAS